MRDNKGRFVKGESASPSTQFKKGQHWRKPQKFRDKSWLIEEYVNKKRSTGDISKQFNVTEQSILFWLQRHGIPRRTISEARAVKHWGLSGKLNGMYGVRGEKNSNWKGGVTPFRQALYSKSEWTEIAEKIRQRDKVCRMCGSSDKTDIHHIVSLKDAPLMVMDEGNLILLCKKCHGKTRRKGNKLEKELYKLLHE